jgi:hypothetical protein
MAVHVNNFPQPERGSVTRSNVASQVCIQIEHCKILMSQSLATFQFHFCPTTFKTFSVFASSQTLPVVRYLRLLKSSRNFPSAISKC